jgi:hypothetical protein
MPPGFTGESEVLVSEVARPEVALREVTRETLGEILKLKVAVGQEQFVANNAVSIAVSTSDARVIGTYPSAAISEW